MDVGCRYRRCASGVLHVDAVSAPLGYASCCLAINRSLTGTAKPGIHLSQSDKARHLLTGEGTGKGYDRQEGYCCLSKLLCRDSVVGWAPA